MARCHSPLASAILNLNLTSCLPYPAGIQELLKAQGTSIVCSDLPEREVLLTYSICHFPFLSQLILISLLLGSPDK